MDPCHSQITAQSREHGDVLASAVPRPAPGAAITKPWVLSCVPPARHQRRLLVHRHGRQCKCYLCTPVLAPRLCALQKAHPVLPAPPRHADLSRTGCVWTFCLTSQSWTGSVSLSLGQKGQPGWQRRRQARAADDLLQVLSVPAGAGGWSLGPTEQESASHRDSHT